jgi:hypothetical protein
MDKTAFRIGDYSDRRLKWQLEAARAIDQKRADQAIEKLWAARIKENVLRRIAAKVNGHG